MRHQDLCGEGAYVAEYYDGSSDAFFASKAATIIEYFNPTSGHYFYTGDAAEVDQLDTGTITGWQRTGESFQAIPAERMPSFAQPVCRFYARLLT